MRTGFKLLLGAAALIFVTRIEVFASSSNTAVASAAIAPGTASIAFACFVADEQDSGSIYRVSTDGSAVQALAPQVRAARAPAWSKDGRSLVFQGDRDNWLAKLMNYGGNEELYVVGDSGSNLRQLTDNWNADLTPVWSPDGQWLAFAALDGFAGQNIYRMRADGSDRRQLTSGFKADSQLAWSADGQQIAFTTTADGTRWLYTMNADGRNLKPIAHDRSMTALAWSADGRWISYRTLDSVQTRVSAQGDTIQYLHFSGVDPVWSSVRPATQAMGRIKPVALLRPTDFSVRAVVHVPVDVTNITESPDGQWIAYTSQSYAPGPVFAQLFKMRIDGSDVQQLTQMPCNTYDPSWSPEATALG